MAIDSNEKGLHPIYHRAKACVPGLLLVIVLGIAARTATGLFPLPGAVSIAIILGMFSGNLIPRKEMFKEGVLFSEKRLLPLAIALLGTTLNLDVLFALGLPALFMITTMVAFIILVARYLGRFFGLSPSLSLLMGTGNAVCGSSAIAAVSRTIPTTEEEVGISVGIVNLMGVIGLFLLPMVLIPLQLSDKANALLIGGSLQAVGQVVASGYSMSATIGATAVLVKMGRVLLLGPIVIVFGLFNKKTKGQGKGSAFKFPFFILSFFIFSFLTSYNYLPKDIAGMLATSGKLLLVIAMAGIGFRIQFSSLLRQGTRVFFFGLLLTLIQLSYIIAWLFIL